MYRTASIAAYDVLDQVVVAATVMTYEGFSEEDACSILRTSVQVRGAGVETDHQWLRDALVALAETL